MKCQVLFSLKNYKNKISSATSLLRALRAETKLVGIHNEHYNICFGAKISKSKMLSKTVANNILFFFSLVL